MSRLPRGDVAYQALRRAIIEQALHPGTRLPEDEIGAHFWMSRTMVRATLARLCAEGLVESLPRRTATVARPTLEEAREIFAVRRALEREAVAWIAAAWRPEFGAELEGHVREEDAARMRADSPLSIRLAGEFHIKLAALTGNRVLARYLSELVSRCSLILALYGRPHSSDCAVTEHAEIIAALRQGDADGAMRLMEQHIGAVEGRALLSDGQSDRPTLGKVLARYARTLEAGNAAVPLAARRKVRAV